MRVAYGDSNVLKCSVQLAYDRFFTDFGYSDTHQVPVNNFLPSQPNFTGIGANKDYTIEDVFSTVNPNKNKETLGSGIYGQFMPSNPNYRGAS